MYSPEIVANFTHPTHNGALDAPDRLVETKDPVCGDQVKLWLTLKENHVETARFQAWGCATSVASANILCNWIEGRHIDEIAAATSTDLAALLGTVRPEQTHCIHIMQTLIDEIVAGAQS